MEVMAGLQKLQLERGHQDVLMSHMTDYLTMNIPFL